MNNVTKLPQPGGGKKCKHPLSLRLFMVAVIIFGMAKLPLFFDNRPPIYRQHNVVLKHNAAQIPPDFMVYDLSGRQTRLRDELGDNVTLLAFWATWCGYCAAEFPQIDALAPGLASHGVKILPLSRGDDTPEKIHQFFSRLHLKNITSFIPTTSELHREFSIVGYPAFVLVDAQGMALAELRPNWAASDITELFASLAGRKE